MSWDLVAAIADAALVEEPQPLRLEQGKLVLGAVQPERMVRQVRGAAARIRRR